MRKVTKEVFFSTVGPLNVHPKIVNNSYPYTSDWMVNNGRDSVGRTVGVYKTPGVVVNEYYLK